MEFKDLGLESGVLKAVEKLGFKEPSEIQEKAIPVLIKGEDDFVGLAQTGTGKTAAYGLPAIQYTDFSINHTQVLVVCPTRELCMQITKDLENFAKFQDKPNIVPVYGGSSIMDQIQRIKKGAHIVVATPGRLLDLINRKAVKLKTVTRVILDEADEMLNMGFKEDIDAILEQTPSSKKVWLFSATMPKEVRRIAKNYMHEPVEITIGKQNALAVNIEHQYFMMKERDRYYALKRILDYYPDIFGLIFCRTRRETGQVSEKLEKDGYNVVSLHGDLSQGQRDAAMKKFRDRTASILVATDVAARGLDVDDITHVIHYNLPDDHENYTHRSGRTARAGRSGLSLTLINTREIYKINQIQKSGNINIEYKAIPHAEDICEKRMYAMMDKVIKTQVDDEAIERYWPVIYEKLQRFTSDEIVMKFISAEFNSYLDYYKSAGNLNAKEDEERGGRGRGDRDKGERDRRGRTESGSQNRNLSGPKAKYFINLGEKMNMNKGALLRLICTGTGISSNQIGRIDVQRAFSFFEVDESVAHKILPKMEEGSYEGKTFVIAPSQEKGSKPKHDKKRK
ncbi:DEAD/DEAH box helicase [Bacteroidota bacterium]